jgi:hypothetical protein
MNTFVLFIRPRISTVALTLVIVCVAFVLFVQMIDCVLDGAGRCHLPLALQLLTGFLIWPWFAILGLLHSLTGYAGNIASVIGFALTLMWMYLLACVIRFVAIRLMSMSQK